MAASQNPLAAGDELAAPSASASEGEMQAVLDSIEDLSAESKSALQAWVDMKLRQPPPPGPADGGLGSAVTSIVAHLTEAPLNWHQVSVFALSRRPGGEDEALRQKGPMLAAVGALMVWMQCATVIGVLQGTLYPSCKSNDQCLTKGTYCAIGGRYPQDPNCWYCGTTAPLGAQVDDETDRGVLNDIESPHYAGMNSTYVQLLCHDPANFVWGEKRPPPEWDEHNQVGFGSQQQQEENPLWQSNVKSWCDACFHLESGTVSEATGWSIPADNITTMGLADYVTYLFAAAFVALTLVGELKVHAC